MAGDWLRRGALEFTRGLHWVTFRAVTPKLGLTKSVLQLLSLPLPQLVLTVPNQMAAADWMSYLQPDGGVWLDLPSPCSLLSSCGSLWSSSTSPVSSIAYF